MKHFLPVILLALSLVVVAGCGNQGGNANADRTIERPIGHGPITVRTVRDGMNERFSLTMHVVVLAREQRAFERQYARYEQRVIDRVEAIMRAATPEERMDEEFTAIKAKSIQAISDILGTPWVQEVLISDVTFETF